MLHAALGAAASLQTTFCDIVCTNSTVNCNGTSHLQTSCPHRLQQSKSLYNGDDVMQCNKWESCIPLLVRSMDSDLSSSGCLRLRPSGLCWPGMCCCKNVTAASNVATCRYEIQSMVSTVTMPTAVCWPGMRCSRNVTAASSVAACNRNLWSMVSM